MNNTICTSSVCGNSCMQSKDSCFKDVKETTTVDGVLHMPQGCSTTLYTFYILYTLFVTYYVIYMLNVVWKPIKSFFFKLSNVQNQKNPTPCILQNIRIIFNGQTISSKIKIRNRNLKENWNRRTARKCLTTSPISYLHKGPPDSRQHNYYLRRWFSNLSQTWISSDSFSETPSHHQ
jgi:hypothetical protein